MKKILIIYHSQGGNTKRMAESVATGVNAVNGVKAILRPAREANLEELLYCDALAIGSPEYFGYMAGMVKDFFDRTYEAARGKKEIFRKPYILFISAGNDGSGALASIERILIGYQLRKVQPPLVAKGKLTQEILEKCRELGQTLAAGCEAGIF